MDVGGGSIQRAVLELREFADPRSDAAVRMPRTVNDERDGEECERQQRTDNSLAPKRQPCTAMDSLKHTRWFPLSRSGTYRNRIGMFKLA